MTQENDHCGSSFKPLISNVLVFFKPCDKLLGMCTTANNRETIEPRIIQLVRELTAAPATDEAADALETGDGTGCGPSRLLQPWEANDCVRCSHWTPSIFLPAT